MVRNVSLTPAVIDAARPGRLRDGRTPGLVLEVRTGGAKIWRYARRIARTDTIVRVRLGGYPAYALADARAWAAALNEQVEVGVDPREAAREAQARELMTVARAHELYMMAVREGRASRAKRLNKPRTISDKQKIFDRDVSAKLKRKSVYAVTEKDLIELVTAKGKTAKVRANRLLAELKVFFGWAASLRGMEVGLEADPSHRLGDLRFPETARARRLDLLEIEWFLLAVAEEPRDFRRGMILWLLTAARISEVILARADEIETGIWTIPERRVKNGCAHRIALGPWAQRLIQTNNEWVFPAERVDGPRRSGWYKARDRVHARMESLAGRPIDRFTPHDFRRTARSNTKRLDVDFETAEAMLNHVKKGLERTYDLYELEDEKRIWFLRWEAEVSRIAIKAGIAGALEVPSSTKRVDAFSRARASRCFADPSLAPVANDW